ncbi:NUDIX hydrolase [uncultured Desulfovibrio sp.]|uniref:NUDIX hydrolase n=1 Tax=Candidatus Desulfovibrio intestinavium TaxID=2838534 RepID=A0A9D2HN14_9BACT|nr:NUDIX hydrolase [uncultured Desulfovibrio sp.]HJA79192.1 NUDIX hydrolase [Candidatus Desulfovibrio intestinavium]
MRNRPLRAGAHALLEVVDARNRPFCHLAAPLVREQRLAHRQVCLLVRAGDGILLARSAEGWDIFAREAVPAGDSVQECAERLARRQELDNGRLRELGVLPPCPATGQAFVSLFSVRVTPSRLRLLAEDAATRLVLDQAELFGLARHGGDLLSPLLRHALLESGLLR